MKKSSYHCIAVLMCSVQAYAQVGIGISTPNAVLDINGKTTLRKELKVGGTSDQAGNAGLNGQVLVSQGAGLPPVWRSLNVSFIEEGQYKLINSYLSSDQAGITSLSGGIAADGIYTNSVGDDFSNTAKGRWVKIDNLRNVFEIKNAKNRLTYQFQTGIEMKAPAAGTPQSVTFTCGVFRNNKLVAVRPDKITSNNNTDKGGFQDYIFTLNYTEQNVPEGSQTIEVACRKIESSNSNTLFAIGRNIDNSNTVSNAFTQESDFKVDVIEYVTYKTN
ncbi:hypothetical protein VUJ46_16685 [Chryseobacterium sp. MYb264]|uniref:hypothetical protein n=1 Tax=Chryseobacterium sp. MYb264 TaxID=2745153 RepID=UPI002E0D7451|nr:hypothetical protein VUJ46_16685 [Chryseobacterium sp. MYb264]